MNNNSISGLIKQQSPSNIAIVKYWGKTGIQIPINPSISFSLTNCITQTAIQYNHDNKQKNYAFNFSFHGERNTQFENKLNTFFKRIEKSLPWLRNYYLKINSTNTFPHSSGIASSASGYGALANALAKIHEQITATPLNSNTISEIARLGSGSACRSVNNGWNTWGIAKLNGGSNLFATNLNHSIHPSFKSIQDTILIVSNDKKPISSTLGHQLMNNHPYKEARIIQANTNFNRLIAALKVGDWDQFILISESEALSLHGLMLSSEPGYTLLLPNSLKIIEKIRLFRQETKIPICFTIDAGPNIHILYPHENKKQIQEFIQTNLVKLYTDKIDDAIC